MSDKNYNTNCRFAAEIVSYLYDEIETREKAVFETHLKSCTSCTGMLADFSFARFAIQDWRDEKFSHLQTPSFEIPFDIKQTKESVSVNSISLFDNLRQIFSLRPIWATGAATLVLVIGLVFAATHLFEPAFNAKNDESNVANVAVSPAEKHVEQTVSEITVEPETANTFEPVTPAVKKYAPEKSEVTQKARVTETPVTEIRRNSSVKVSDRFSEREPKTGNTKKIAEDIAASDVKDFNKKNTNDAPAINRQIPTLNSFEEYEDNTLRLAELFEDIDTRK